MSCSSGAVVKKEDKMNYQYGCIRTGFGPQRQGPLTFTQQGKLVELDEAIPNWFACFAEAGGFMPSDEVLRATGYRLGSRRPRGWEPSEGEGTRNISCFYKRFSPNDLCAVYRFEKGWAVDRCTLMSGVEALVFSPAPFLVLTSTYQAAMRLAEFCFRHPPDKMGLFQWMR
jgi:hypothetical protein